VAGAALAAAGLGVTGAYLGTPLSFIAMCIYCAIALRRHVEQVTGAPLERGRAHAAALELWTHVRRAWVPIGGLIVIAVLQNIDIIAAKHRMGGVKDLASSYAATAVAAKVLIWVAVGAGFYLVPEVSRRRAEGVETRPVLFRALGIIFVCAVPVLLIFAVAAKPLLRIAFGSNRTLASSSLLVLGVAFTVLACTYLAIQYMLALKRTWFLLAIGAVAVAEPILLLNASRNPAAFAGVVLAVQAVGAVLAFGLALRNPRHPGPVAPRGTLGASTISGTPDIQPPARPPRATAGSTQRG
jgi:O-antigen/teichoic acid export membrane protein